MTRVRVPATDIEEDVSAEQVVVYLLAKGWTEMADASSSSFVEYELNPVEPDGANDGACGVPRNSAKRYAANLAECIADIARAEGRHPSAVLDDIVGPAVGSAGARCSPIPGSRFVRCGPRKVYFYPVVEGEDEAPIVTTGADRADSAAHGAGEDEETT